MIQAWIAALLLMPVLVPAQTHAEAAPSDLFAEAAGLYDRGDFEAATRLYDRLLTDAPRDVVKFADLPTPPEGAEISRIDVVVRVRRRD